MAEPRTWWVCTNEHCMAHESGRLFDERIAREHAKWTPHVLQRVDDSQITMSREGES